MSKNKGGNNNSDMKGPGMTNETSEMTNLQQNTQNKSGSGKNKGSNKKGGK